MEAVCFNCGEPLGYTRRAGDEPDSCGLVECNRELQRAYAEERAERRQRAEDDDYERY